MEVEVRGCMSFREKETIHSGHFMISTVPQDDEEDLDDGVGVDSDSEEASDHPLESSQGTLSDRISGDKAGDAVSHPHKIAGYILGGGGGKRRSSSSRKNSQSCHNSIQPPASYHGDGASASMNVEVPVGRHRSNSDPMNEDAFGNRSRVNLAQRKGLDSSLSQLFECMTLAYKAKLTSPKWNNFKGLKLRWTIKIRLNNVIWRAWHMQFVKQMRPLIAPFAIEVDTSPHNKSEAVVLEGKYWKRRLSMVSAEYRKWRVWYKDRDKATGLSTQPTPAPGVNYYDSSYMERYTEASGNNNWLQQQVDQDQMMIDEEFPYMPDFADALLARLTNQPFAFPDPREIAQAGNADFIQPGLLQLQPSLEDLMDTLEPLTEYFSSQGHISGYGSQGSSFSVGSGGLASDPYLSCDNYWRQTTMQDMSGTMGMGVGVGVGVGEANSPLPLSRNKMASRLSPYNMLSSYSTYPCAPSATHQQQSILSPPYQQQQQINSTFPSSNNPSSEIFRPTLEPSLSVEDMELRKQEMRQRSMSGPTPGQPLIDPSVFAALASYNRSLSASSGNVAQPSMIPEPPAVLHPRPPADTFAVPQPKTNPRGRRPKQSRTAENVVRVKVTQLSSAAPHGVASANENSTLAQLLTSGSSVFGKGTPVRSGNKKLAPKPPSLSAQKEGVKSRAGVALLNTANQMQGFCFNEEEDSTGDGITPKIEYSPVSEYRLKLEEGDKSRSTENRRILHITAEQKRRGHIKSGFEILHGLVPSLAQNSSVKVSKALVLHKGAEYIHQLKEERERMQTEADALKRQIDNINKAVIVCQQQLPATGAPVANRARNDRMNEMMEEVIRTRTLQNWKFWLFSQVMRPLFETYVSNVSSRSVEELCQSSLSWVDQHCTLVHLRPMIKDAMRKLSTSTHVLSDPTRLPEEARYAVQKCYMTSSTTSATSAQQPSASSFT